jgi:hypothetical protein
MKRAMILSLLMASWFVFAAGAAFALMPEGKVGEPWDGVNFDELLPKSADGGITYSGIYYGAYDHIASYDEGISEGVKTSVLWRVMGEELDDGNITLMSEYILDKYIFTGNPYRAGSNIWRDSEIRGWLNGGHEGEFLGGTFTTAEFKPIVSSDVKTTEYDGFGMENKDTVSTTDRFYLLRTIMWADIEHPTNHGKVSWFADDSVDYPGLRDEKAYLVDENGESVFEDDAGKIHSSPGALRAGLRNGTEVNQYWLRSPWYSTRAKDTNDRGYTVAGDTINFRITDNASGVRPVFKLDPKFVIYKEEVSRGINSVTSRDCKLTVLNDNRRDLTAGRLMVRDRIVSSDLGITAVISNDIYVSSTGATDGTRLTYKIVVLSDDGRREIVGHGQGDEEGVSVDITVLPIGRDYTVYVWAQRDGGINSNEGSRPRYFTLTTSDGGISGGEIEGDCGGCNAGFGVTAAFVFWAVLQTILKRPQRM